MMILQFVLRLPQVSFSEWSTIYLRMSKHIYIPDCQIRPGDDTKFLENIGKYIVDQKPDVLICGGDFADMPSLSSYDVGKKSFEGRRYKADTEAAVSAMATLLRPLQEHNQRAKRNKEKQYKPRMVLTLGNHEDRITRAVNNDPKLDGTIGLHDLHYSDFGWDVVPFLQPVIIDDIAYCHYFVTGVAGRPSVSAASQLAKQHMSCVAGHQQGLQISTGYNAAGTRLTSIIAGSCYEHDEDYLGHQGNRHWRGVLVFHEVNKGQFDLMPVSLDYLNKRYDNKD